MDDAQKKPQTNINVQNSPSTAKEVEKPFVVTESVPSIELDQEVKEAGVEVEDSPDLTPHEIIKSNIEIPAPVIPSALDAPVAPVKTISSVKVLRRKKLYTNPKEANAWKEEVEIREDLKKVA